MIHALFHNMPTMAKRASFPPLLELLDCRVHTYNCLWGLLQNRSWTLGQTLRDWGVRYYGSSWNWFIPYLHEWVLSRQAAAVAGDVVHFLMAEFGSPRHPAWFNRRGARLVGTFHCSSRRLPAVLEQYHGEVAFDRISLMSASQIPFFMERGYPADRMDVTMHGVDTAYFRPLPGRAPDPTSPLKLLLVGSTERDHAFAGEVMRRIHSGRARLDVLTDPKNHRHYQDIPSVRIMQTLTDEELMASYQRADLLLLPVEDCTANNTVLEAMACGTPVMVNRVGGMPEYVDAASSFVLEGKNVDEWVELVNSLARNRDVLESRRPAVRAWAETLDWHVVMHQYTAFYQKALAAPPIAAAGKGVLVRAR